jgi:uncharacterized protein YkwD
MRNLYLFLLLIAVLSIQEQTVSTPYKNINLDFKLSDEGKPSYSVTYKLKQIVNISNLGLTLKDASNLETNFRIDSIGQNKINETWHPVLCE